MKAEDIKEFHGTFKVVDGILDFTCTTKNVSFKEVEEGLIKLRDEINRQLENKDKCPYNVN